MASKISKTMAQQLVKALGNPSYEVVGARTNTERALRDRGLIFHGQLREVVKDARGHQVRTHGMMLTDEGVKEAQRLAAEAAEERGEEPQEAEVTREDVARGVDDALQWVHFGDRDAARARGAVRVLEVEFSRARRVMRKLLGSNRYEVEAQAVAYYGRVRALLAAAKRFEAEDAQTQGEKIAREVFQVPEEDVPSMGRAIADAAQEAEDAAPQDERAQSAAVLAGVDTRGMVDTSDGYARAFRYEGTAVRVWAADVKGVTRWHVEDASGAEVLDTPHPQDAFNEAAAQRPAVEERPAGVVDVMRAEAESVSAVSEAFAARVRGEERPQEPDMAAMSEEEHAAAFGERFAQVRRARVEAAQEGRAADNLYKYDREYARLRDRRAVAEGVMDAGHAAEYAPAYSLYNRHLAGRVVAGVLATRAHWVNSNNGAAEVERMSTTEQARQYASLFKPLARVDSGPHACTLVFADGTTESLTSYDTVCLLPAPQD